MVFVKTNDVTCRDRKDVYRVNPTCADEGPLRRIHIYIYSYKSCVNQVPGDIAACIGGKKHICSSTHIHTRLLLGREFQDCHCAAFVQVTAKCDPSGESCQSTFRLAYFFVHVICYWRLTVKYTAYIWGKFNSIFPEKLWESNFVSLWL